LINNRFVSRKGTGFPSSLAAVSRVFLPVELPSMLLPMYFQSRKAYHVRNISNITLIKIFM